MPSDPREAETTHMRVMTLSLETKGAGSLSEYIALSRLPGPTWQSWDDISFHLREMTGFRASRQGLIDWSRRYGIPAETRASDGPELIKRYREEIRRAGIRLPVRT